MRKQPIIVQMDPDMVEAIEAVRGDVPRAAWIRRAVEAALVPHSVDAPS